MRKLFIIGAFVLLGALSFFVFSSDFCIGCSPTGFVIDSVSASEFSLALEEDVVLIDIRTPHEFSQGHIEGAKNINFYSNSFKLELEELDRNTNYLIYCRTGSRSGHAMNIMKDLGFENVFELRGGINNWVRRGFSVVS